MKRRKVKIEKVKIFYLERVVICLNILIFIYIEEKKEVKKQNQREEEKTVKIEYKEEKEDIFNFEEVDESHIKKLPQFVTMAGNEYQNFAALDLNEKYLYLQGKLIIII